MKQPPPDTTLEGEMGPKVLEDKYVMLFVSRDYRVSVPVRRAIRRHVSDLIKEWGSGT